MKTEHKCTTGRPAILNLITITMGLPEKVALLSVIAVIISLNTIKCSPRSLKKNLLKSIMSTKTADKDEETIVPLNKINNIRLIKPIKNMLYRKFVPSTVSRSEAVKEADIKPNFCDKTNQPVWTKPIGCPKIDAELSRKYDFPAIEYPSFDNPDDPYGINDGTFPEVVYPLAAEDLWYPSRFKPFSTKSQPLTRLPCKCNKHLAGTNSETMKKNLLRSNINKNTPVVRGNRINRKINANTCKGNKNVNLKSLDVKVPRKYSKNCYVAPSTIRKIEQSCKTSPRMSLTTCPPSTNVNFSTVESTYLDTLNDTDIFPSQLSTISNVLTTVDSSITPTPQSNNSDLFTTVDDKITQASPEAITEQIYTITYFTTEPSFITPSSDNITQPSSTYTTVALLPDITGSSAIDSPFATHATTTISPITPLVSEDFTSFTKNAPSDKTTFFNPTKAEIESLSLSTTYTTPMNEIDSTFISSVDSYTHSSSSYTQKASTETPDSMNSFIPNEISSSILPSPISSDEGVTSDPDDLSENILKLTSKSDFPTDNSEASVTSVFDNRSSIITSPIDAAQDGYLEPDLLQFIFPEGDTSFAIDDI